MRFDTTFKDDNVVYVSYEISQEVTTVKRSLAGFLDYISDLGGLAASLSSGCSAIIMLLQFRALQQFLTPYLFAISTEIKKEDRFKKPTKEGGDPSPELKSAIPL